MRGDVMQAVMATWAARDLPARLDVSETAKLLGFAEHDVRILMGSGKLTPLGDPAPNAPKWFAAMEIIQLAADHDWLHRATREVSKYWRVHRDRRHAVHPSLRSRSRQPVSIAAEKVSPESSPEPSLNERWTSNEAAIASDEQAVAKVA